MLLCTYLGDATNIAGELYGTGSWCFQQGGPWTLTLDTRRIATQVVVIG